MGVKLSECNRGQLVRASNGLKKHIKDCCFFVNVPPHFDSDASRTSEIGAMTRMRVRFNNFLHFLES